MTDQDSGTPPKRPVRIPRPQEVQSYDHVSLTPPPVGNLKNVLGELSHEPPAVAHIEAESVRPSDQLAETIRPEAYDARGVDAQGAEIDRESWPGPLLRVHDDAVDPLADDDLFDDIAEADDELRASVLPEAMSDGRSPSGSPKRPSDAPGHLRDRGLTSAWKARAEWFEQQAEQTPDHAKRGRAWLVASELWAMTGTTDRARTAADRASKYGNALGARQARQLAAADEDPVALGILAAEIHSAPTPAARTHAAAMSAEHERARGADPSVVTRYLDQTARSDAADPRPGLFKLARQIGTSNKPPSFKWSKLEPHAALDRATHTLATLRGDTRSVATTETSAAPVVTFFEIKRALARADRVGAATSLVALAADPPLSRSARWLASALFAPLASTRGKSAELLSELLRERSTAAVRRALGARALELGDRALLDSALANDSSTETSDPALSVPDRIAFACLLDAPPEAMLPWLDHAARQDELRPLAGAMFAALDRPLAHLSSGAVRVGRILGAGGSPADLSIALSSATDLSPELSGTLELEIAFQRQDVQDVGNALVALSDPHNEQSHAISHLASGLMLEHAGQTEAAERHYGRALGAGLFAEAATRAVITLVPRSRTTKLLAALAGTTKDEERRALLLFEAALYSKDRNEAVDLAEASFELGAHLGLPSALGQRLTLPDDAPTRALTWLNNEASLAESDYERALIAVRQALLSGADPEQAAFYLNKAWELWPRDVTLLELQERLTTAPLAIRAKNRELLAASLTDVSARARLLLEAARYYEHSGQDADAARVAEAAQRSEPLARVCFDRAAARTPRVVSVKNALESEIANSTRARRRAELCLELAALEARANNDVAQGRWLKDACSYDPTFMRALLEYEQFALQRGLGRELGALEQQLAQLVSQAESSAHALLSARFEQLTTGWNAALPPLRLAHRGAETPFWVARKLLPHAARGADDELYYTLLDVVQRECTRDVDKATLLLRSAETATRLGNGARAMEHIETATRLAPNHLVAQSMRAELLTAQGDDPARAAEAHERVARLSCVAEHQTLAWKTAARLWTEAEDTDRAQGALERAFKTSPTDDEVFEHLLQHYRQAHAAQKLTELLRARIEAARRNDERLRLRLLECNILTELGDSKGARANLEQLLSSNPEDVVVLTQLAQLNEAESDAAGSERVLLQLARLNPDPETQADTYAKLAHLYQGPLAQPLRALRCFQEVLRRRANDWNAFSALVALLVEQRQVERAVSLIAEQEKLVQNEDGERALALCSARLQARGLRDFQAAEAAFQSALVRWPKHPQVLAGLVELHQFSVNRKGISELAGGYCAEARSLLPDKPGLDEAVSAARLVAELDSDDCGATLINVAQQLFLGRPTLWPGAQGRAMSRNLDELLAPNPISSALRSLLMQTHAVLDRAFELDLAEIGAEPLDNQRVLTCFEVKARSMGIACPQLFVISGNPHACLVTNNPSRVILGSAWIEALPSALDFLAWRSLKLVQARVGIIERLRGQQLLATLEAFLGCFVDARPGLADPRLVEAMRRRLVDHLPKRLDDDLPVLALSVLTDLKERQLPIDDAIRRWVNRSALLATGDLRAALNAVALKHGEIPPGSSDATIRFLKQSPEALDLVGSLFDTGFLDACRMTKEPTT